MTYNHGIMVDQRPFVLQLKGQPSAFVQVFFGTAAIHLSDDPYSVTNKPILITGRSEAEQKLGFNDDFEAFTLNQAIDACFVEVGTPSAVFVNVLDPIKHSTEETMEVEVVNDMVTITGKNVLLPSIQIDGLVKNEDFMVGRDDRKNVVIHILDQSKVTEGKINMTFKVVDPEKVTSADIIGGYDAETNTYQGLELIRMIYPQLSVLPKIISAPGFSRAAEVGTLLAAKSRKINGEFNAFALIDVDGESEQEAISKKEENGFNHGSSYVCWPNIRRGQKVYDFSAYLSARMAKQDADHAEVPFHSPSNQLLSISGLITPEGKEVFLDQVAGNQLNAKGIMTAINMAGWRTWGNVTAAYHDELEEVEIKDRFAVMRRMFDWWSNTFIINYFNKVDKPTDTRLIESLIDSENIRANGFRGAGQIAGARIEFRKEDNPDEQLLNGKIQFIQRVAFFSPAESIVNVLEFDPTILNEALFGGA
ncbi:hypothetical protein BTR22_19205 [Alkalihalophilus pseudofirmus]|uniref:phage tail sheath family protein n=1 Tax=Alkalihalophilus pseudofirmus TaxID=79885 RepID=UPI000953266A|nr:hypothetical protein BTR22_19205 [Alkalihalophilus pseudofirmus]